MSLMNYGFTKSKLDEKDDKRQEKDKNKEKSSKSPSKSPNKKETSKEKKTSSSKTSPNKKDSKNSKTNSPAKKESSKKINSNSPSKKPSPKKQASGIKQSVKSSPISKNSNKINDVRKSVSVSNGTSSSNGNNNISPKKNPTDVSLPYVRIKMIMRSSPDVEAVPHTALHITTKATELFIQHLATESFKASNNGKLDYEALSCKVHNEDNLEFLRETIPKKITWAACQKIIASKRSNTSEEFL